MTKLNEKTIYTTAYLNPQNGNGYQAASTVSDPFGIATDALNWMHAAYCTRAPTFPNAPVPNSGHNWAATRGEEVNRADQMHGYIFMCNGKTKTDCYMYRVFGLPSARLKDVEKIKPRMKLFLFDFDSKLLYGVYAAASTGELAIEPNAFGGKFSAQVRFDIFKECLPLPESAFKHAIKDNYMSGSKFRQELSDKQVAELMSLFRPLAEVRPASATSFVGRVVPPDGNLRIQQLLPPGVADGSQHFLRGPPFPPLPDTPDTLMANVDALRPAGESTIFLQKVPQVQSNQLFPEQTHLSYFPQKYTSSLISDTAVPDDTQRGNVPGLENTCRNYIQSTVASTTFVHPHFLPVQSSIPRSGHAYWAQVAAEDREWVCAGATYPTMPGSGEGALILHSQVNDSNHNPVSAQAQSSMSMQPHTSVYGPVHLQSSSYPAAYWAGVAAADATLPSSISLGPSRGAVPGISEERVSQFNTANGDYNNSLALISSAYASSQDSSEAARYWPTTAYNMSSQ